jgi:hypothetical protein
VKPYIHEQGHLVVPSDSPRKYKWWLKGTMSLEDILRELKVNEETWKRYTDEEYETKENSRQG